MKKSLILISFIALALGFTACTATTTETTVTDISTTEINKVISVTDQDVEMSLGSEYYIDYEMNFVLKESESISFESSNSEVATVSMLGKVTGVGYGDCEITLSFAGAESEVVRISISSTYEVTPPNKTIYKSGEAISTNGASLKIMDEQGAVIETVALTNAMLADFNPETTGSQIVNFVYDDLIYGFEVYVLNEKQELSLFNDFIYLNQNLVMGEMLEFALTKGNTDEFLAAVDNVYDYNEINIYALIESPSGEVKRVSAFWYQDFNERLTDITINTNLNLEGKVQDTAWDYDVFLQYLSNNDPQYRLRFTPEESGSYTSTLVVEVDGDIIQTITKEFSVLEATDDDFKGYIQVDSSNNRSFIFDDGESYVAVGQNVAWYTSVERKYYDYQNWFDRMGEVGMNYARVWLAAWGFSPFWRDVYNYDQRQSAMYSLDRTIEIADDNDIYIQLCLLHHGMFSQEVNPMWPNSEDTWYTNKYGANPYGDIISNPGLFFASSEIKENYKNQLKYIIARYGYSDNIMSWELFNEVDWIETYTASAGNLWHQEMAQYIDSIDPNNHMITTSLNNQSFLSNNYQVFALDEIDFVNVHHYGIYNHVAYLPKQQNNVFEIFNKPVIYDEVGYQGWGGQQQMESDPNNVTLHQELWAGALGGGAGSGMNWWWESWIEPYDVYSEFKGLATYASQMDLNADYQVVASTDGDYAALSINSSNGYIGYLMDDRAYLYVYDVAYDLDHQTVALKSNTTFVIPNLVNGTYTLSCYDTYSGLVFHTHTIIVDDNFASVSLPGYYEDIAISLKLSD